MGPGKHHAGVTVQALVRLCLLLVAGPAAAEAAAAPARGHCEIRFQPPGSLLSAS